MSRDSFLSKVPLEEIQPLYAAMKLYHDMMYHQDNVVHVKLSPGESTLVAMEIYTHTTVLCYVIAHIVYIYISKPL